MPSGDYGIIVEIDGVPVAVALVSTSGVPDQIQWLTEIVHQACIRVLDEHRDGIGPHCCAASSRLLRPAMNQGSADKSECATDQPSGCATR
jgi:hypothetical protein